jgi:hypothetical protein
VAQPLQDLDGCPTRIGKERLADACGEESDLHS